MCLCNRGDFMVLQTERLTLRPWAAADAASLYAYASDPAVGPAAGWPPHRDEAESLRIIQTVFNGPACYAICVKDEAIGAIELKTGDRTDMTDRADECELGYWLGRPFWGRGYMPEAVREILRHAFADLGMRTVWCGYYDGNEKSRRVQEKVGFVYHHTCDAVPVPLLGETRVGHTSCMTCQRWQALNEI